MTTTTQLKNETLNRAISAITALDHDLQRIAKLDAEACASIGACLEHRAQMLNRLRHIRQQAAPSIPSQVLLNAISGPYGDPEIAPPPRDREPSALAAFRRRQRCAQRLAVIIALAAAAVLGGCVKIAFDLLK